MDAQNPFLNAYKHKLNEQTGRETADAPAAAVEPAAASQPLVPAMAATRQVQENAALRNWAFRTPSADVAADGYRTAGSRTADAEAARFRRRAAAIAISGAVLIAIVLLVVWLLGRGTEAIDFKGWTISDAQVWASDNRVNLQVDREYNDAVEVDRIVSQNLKAGTRIARNGFIRIVVSDGHDLSVQLPLPDLKAMSKAEVEAWAAKNFMSKVRITAEYHANIAAGRVIRYEINDDTVVDLVRRSTPVYVIISKGPEPVVVKQVEIPNFKEMALPQAQQFAQDKGLVLKIVQQYDDLLPAGTIISQSMAAETNVDAGTEVALTVSKGKLVLVPDFSKLSRQKATSVAAAAGITVAMVEQYSSSGAGAFLSQSMAAGAEYKAGEVLELAYSLGNQIVVASFVGQTRAAAETWAGEVNKQGAGIHISVTQTQNSAPPGTVIHQSPANTVIMAGGTVRITVSLGKMVFIPNLVAPAGSVYGQIVTRDQAAAACAKIGVIPVFQAEKKSGRLPGEVWSQSLAPGKEVYEGTTITLKYCPADVSYRVPDFSGKTREQIAAEGYLTKFELQFAPAATPVPDMAGKVVGQSVSAGQTVAAGTVIALAIG